MTKERRVRVNQRAIQRVPQYFHYNYYICTLKYNMQCKESQFRNLQECMIRVGDNSNRFFTILIYNRSTTVQVSVPELSPLH